MRLRDEQGMMAIGVALMLIVVLSLFGGALWQYSMAEMRRVERTEQDIQALFLARAGAEMVMGAWHQETNSANRPFGTMDPIYYDLDADPNINPSAKPFTTTRPTNYLGPIEVEIRREATTDDEDEGTVIEVTIIESTATVGTTNRTVRLVTYPYRQGDSLYWYDEENGRIKENGYPAPDELIMVDTSSGADLHFHSSTFSSAGSSGSNRSVDFSARYIVIDNPIKLGKNEDNLTDSPNGTVNLVLTAETMFLSGLEIMHLAEKTDWSMHSKSYGLELKLPRVIGEGGSEEIQGRQGAIIKQNDPSAAVDPNLWYGEIYFDEEDVYYQEYNWDRERRYWWFIPYWHYYVETNGGATDLERDIVTLSGNAFYFRDGAVLNSASVSSGDLIPIHPSNAIDRDYLEGLQPFFWDQ